MFCLYTLTLARPTQAEIQMLTIICSIVKLIPWNEVNLSHLYLFNCLSYKSLSISSLCFSSCSSLVWHRALYCWEISLCSLRCSRTSDISKPFWRLLNISTLESSTPSFNPRLFNHELFKTSTFQPMIFQPCTFEPWIFQRLLDIITPEF